MQALRQAPNKAFTKPSTFRPITTSRAFNSTTRTMSNESPKDVGELKIESTNIKTRPGVDLDQQQKTLAGSVLDLFAGRPSLAKLALWKDDATFTDPITIAQGRSKYAAQWYGLQAAFSEIERLNHEVTSSGNPITMDLETRYVVKGIGKEQIVKSIVEIHHDGGKITKVADKWDGEISDSAIKNVSSLLNPFTWERKMEQWAFWAWSFVWETPVWRAFRHLNAVSVPLMVSVPKNAKEDAERGNQ